MNNKENTAVLEMLEEIKAQLSGINRSKEIHNTRIQTIDLSGIEAQASNIRKQIEATGKDISDKIDSIPVATGTDELNRKIDHITELLKRPAKQKQEISHTVSLKSPFVLTYVVTFLLIVGLVVLNGFLISWNNRKKDNDLKYRYIKMLNLENELIWELENTFKYDRNNDEIHKIRKQVEDYENALEKDAERFYLENSLKK